MRNILGWRLLSLLLLCSAVALAKKDKPAVSETPFESVPSNLFYFEDSDIVIVQDVLPGIIYRSTDAGENWKKVVDIKESESLEVIPHPFSNKIAICVGTARTHWITKDQGETWTSFKTDSDPMRGRQTLSFHADDPDKIIFHTLGRCQAFECINEVGVIRSHILSECG